MDQCGSILGNATGNLTFHKKVRTSSLWILSKVLLSDFPEVPFSVSLSVIYFVVHALKVEVLNGYYYSAKCKVFCICFLGREFHVPTMNIWVHMLEC